MDHNLIKYYENKVVSQKKEIIDRKTYRRSTLDNAHNIQIFNMPLIN